MKFKSKGLISLDIDGKVYDYKLFKSLESLSKTKSQRKSAKELNISHTVFNRRLLKAEEKLGLKLTKKVGNGTFLTQDGLNLLDEFRKYQIQIEKLAYELNIDFTPIAYDYLVLISSPNAEEIKSINDLEGLEFINVEGSAQRLAWSSLEHYDIDYSLKYTVNSQFDAFKLVKNSDNLHSFLNASYFNGNDILKFDTRHVISLIKVNEDKPEVDEYIEFLLNDGQKEIEKQGFTLID